MNDLPQWAETTTTIIGIVLAIMIILSVLGFCIYLTISEILTDKKRNEYIQNLDEHDRSIIANYKSIRVYPKRRKNKWVH